MGETASSPPETLTFLFSDIEGSTALLRQVGRVPYAELLDRHEALGRAALEAAGGEVVDAEGDGLFAVFPSGEAAVAGAAAFQRALAAEDWAAGSSVRVRIGIHSGRAERAGRRYIGVAVSRAERVCSAARGGQILLSGTAADLAAEDLPAGVELRDLGVYALKDVGRPERLFEAAVEGLPDVFPAPRAARAETTAARLAGIAGVVAQHLLDRQTLVWVAVLVIFGLVPVIALLTR